jgi:hypothetical protein
VTAAQAEKEKAAQTEECEASWLGDGYLEAQSPDGAAGDEGEHGLDSGAYVPGVDGREAACDSSAGRENVEGLPCRRGEPGDLLKIERPAEGGGSAHGEHIERCRSAGSRRRQRASPASFRARRSRRC